ncbi:MAG: hypothetical protein K6G56_06200 [Clostridiales bacterium]|nr:hypothetical protein [Clostridiales bacterium]
MKHLYKIIALILVFVMAASLAACKTPDPEPKPTDEPAKNTDAPGPAETDQPTAVPQPDYMGKPFDEDFDMAVVINGVTYPIHSDVKDILAALGDGYEYSETISCTRNGMEKTYEYDGIRIDTLPEMDGSDIIGLIVLTGEGFVTPRNIGVGSTREEVIAAYGDNFFDDGYVLTYTKSNDPENIAEKRIQIIFENDVIVELDVYAPDYSD